MTICAHVHSGSHVCIYCFQRNRALLDLQLHYTTLPHGVASITVLMSTATKPL